MTDEDLFARTCVCPPGTPTQLGWGAEECARCHKPRPETLRPEWATTRKLSMS